MPKDNIAYVELGRVKLTEKTSILISKKFEDGKQTGYYVNEFITTPKYTGPTKGASVPTAQLAEFKALVATMI